MAGTLARAEGFSEMPKYRSYWDPHLPKSSAAVLLSIEEANDKNRGRVAASMFRVWAKAEGVLVSMD